MSVSNEMSKTRIISNNRKEIKNLREEQQNHLDKMENQHDKFKSQVRLNNAQELSSIRNEHDRRLADKMHSNEKTFEKLQGSLDQVKQLTEAEKEQLTIELQNKKEFDKSNFEMQMKDRKLQQSLSMTDMDHEAKVEFDRLNTEIEAKRTELNQIKTYELARIKQEGLHQKEMDKNTYVKERSLTKDKFYNALENLKSHQRNQIVTKERQHKNTLDIRDKQYLSESESLKEDYIKKQKDINDKFQNKYATTFEQNNKLMGRLLGKKEKLIDQVKGMITTEAKKELAKKDDSFYQMTDLKPVVTESPERDAYILKVEVPEHEVKQVKLTAFDREIRLSLDRNFDHKRVDDDGSKDTLKRTESYMTKLGVDDIVNSKKITKSYADGQLQFKIEKA